MFLGGFYSGHFFGYFLPFCCTKKSIFGFFSPDKIMKKKFCVKNGKKYPEEKSKMYPTSVFFWDFFRWT